MPLLPALVMLLASGAAVAYEIQDVRVDYQAPRYRIDMQVMLDVPAPAAYALFADPANLPRINPAVKQARIIATAPGALPRLYTDVRMCVSFFCRHIEQVQEMRQAPREDGGALQASVIPELSDLRYGQASWDLRDCGDRTCLRFSAEIEPAFWIPPLIGPWLVQRKLREEAMQTSAGIERLVRETGPGS
jgi:hypothetical protein